MKAVVLLSLMAAAATSVIASHVPSPPVYGGQANTYHHQPYIPHHYGLNLPLTYSHRSPSPTATISLSPTATDSHSPTTKGFLAIMVTPTVVARLQDCSFSL
ncbi:uncharacterized protein [Macrobrachium rosenbergii]|uniref:uncharacterized protein n=1 Tax=Macrobrachium rosenbergii TaxID=79674 RepID=UPI0034D3A787